MLDAILVISMKITVGLFCSTQTCLDLIINSVSRPGSQSDPVFLSKEKKRRKCSIDPHTVDYAAIIEADLNLTAMLNFARRSLKKIKQRMLLAEDSHAERKIISL